MLYFLCCSSEFEPTPITWDVGVSELPAGIDRERFSLLFACLFTGSYPSFCSFI
jgi:hypothetical protein